MDAKCFRVGVTMTETRGGMVEGRRAASLRSQALAAVEEQGLALPAAADLPATLAADLAKLRLFCGEFSSEDGLGTLGIRWRLQTGFDLSGLATQVMNKKRIPRYSQLRWRGVELFRY